VPRTIACEFIAATRRRQGARNSRRLIEEPTITDRRSHFRSVLYVDDDRDICSVVAATLRLVPDLVVQTAESGERAIDLAYEGRPDLVLMDVMMPGLDGPSTFRCMQASALLAHIPVIFMTAKALPTEIAEFLKLGAIGVVVKPFDPVTLYADLLTLWNHQVADLEPSHTGNAQSQVQAQVDALTIGFLERTRADAIHLSTMVALAKDGDRTVMNELERLAHSIHGSAAVFGFHKLSELGATIAKMSVALRESAKNQPAAGEARLMQQLLDSNEMFARAVETAGQAAPRFKDQRWPNRIVS
jgi:two-component system, OmpR family, response regulator